MHQLQSPRVTQRWTSTTALATYLGVSPWTVAHWIREGKLVAHCPQSRHYTDDRPRKTKQGKWRIYEADLAAFMASFRANTPLPSNRGFWRR